jgi:hypothetical protein
MVKQIAMKFVSAMKKQIAMQFAFATMKQIVMQIVMQFELSIRVDSAIVLWFATNYKWNSESNSALMLSNPKMIAWTFECWMEDTHSACPG